MALYRPSPDAAGGGETFLSELKADPGPLRVDTFLAEIGKLRRVRALGLPVGFEGWSERLADQWRHRAARSYPSDLEESNRDVRLTVLAALCHRRTTEITDGLVDLLVQLVDKIDAKAERKVEKELLDEFGNHARQQGWDEQVRRLAARSLRILLAWVGAEAPIHEADIRSLPPDRPGTSARRILQFLTQQGLAISDSGRQRDIHERTVEERIQTVPENLAGELRRWVLVLRGEGRHAHPAMPFETIRKYLGYAA